MLLKLTGTIMPIYEYQCTRCQHQFDQIQKISDPVITTCPNCNQDSVVRLVSAAGFQLKGTGWYATDFKDKGKPKPADSTPPTQTNEAKPIEPSPAKGDNQ